MTAPPRQLTPLWKRLPLIAVGVLGIFLWQGTGGLVATEHHVVWKVPGAYATVRKVELELWDADELLTRIELEAPSGLTADPEKTLTLKRGKYRSRMKVWRAGAAEPELIARDVEVDAEPTVVVR